MCDLKYLCPECRALLRCLKQVVAHSGSRVLGGWQTDDVMVDEGNLKSGMFDLDEDEELVGSILSSG